MTDFTISVMDAASFISPSVHSTERGGPILWGFFGFWHILSLIVAAAAFVGMYFLLRRRKERTQTIVLFIMSLWGIAAIIYNLLMWNEPLEYLPLHLCSINALLIPVMVLTTKTRFGQFLGNLLPVYSIGAVCAVVFNSGQANFEVFSSVFMMYYVPHVCEFAIPWLCLMLGRVKMQPKYIVPCIGTTAVIYTGVHFANVALNAYYVANHIVDYTGELLYANFMFSLNSAGNPALEFFWNLLPKPYNYMYSVFPVVVLLMLIMNIPTFVAMRARAGKAATKSVRAVK